MQTIYTDAMTREQHRAFRHALLAWDDLRETFGELPGGEAWFWAPELLAAGVTGRSSSQRGSTLQVTPNG
jgi:hypothetical protein